MPRSTWVVCAVLLLLTLSVRSSHLLGAESAIRFDHDVRPILAARCFKCHGSDKTEGGLTLADRASALAALETSKRAVVPGDPAHSELLQRITSDDPEYRMPPSGPALTEQEIEVLRNWITTGADWPVHWAWRPLEQPLTGGSAAAPIAWEESPVDAFILSVLKEQELVPSIPADRRTLLRRVYFDLLGLPPTYAEIVAFAADIRPDAYQRVVDRLLANPRYGERWARHWMDIVHYAETHGHDQDRPREHAWRYRDYLIDSFNQDKPYARFVQEQIAGDAMFPGSTEAIIATGFLATGSWDESSLQSIQEDSIDRKIARYIDRDDIVTTVMSTFASSSAHCARCHDHKFDPISQREYYSLQAVFAAIDKADRTFESDPQIAQQRAELVAALASLPARGKQVDASLLTNEIQQQAEIWSQGLLQKLDRWVPVRVKQLKSDNTTELKLLEDGSVLASGVAPEKDVYTIEFETTQRQVSGLRLEVLTHESLPMNGPGRQPNGNLHLNDLRLWLLGPNDNNTRLKLIKPMADFNQGGWSIEKSIDGNPATAWGIHPEVGKPHQAVFSLDTPLDFMTRPTLRVELHQVHGMSHLIGCFRFATTAVPGDLSTEQPPISPGLIQIIRKPRGHRTDAEKAALAEAYLKPQLQTELDSLPPPSMVYCGTNQFTAIGTFRPAEKPRVVNVLHRGDVQQPREEALPGALSVIPGLNGDFSGASSDNEGHRRVALARWMTDPTNGLTWRSIANRLWHYHFGRGLVDTPNDFGRMGSAPTHPQLLDWLASEMRDVEAQGQASSSAMKHIHRLLVTSSTYRQSADNDPQAAKIDAENRLLWRMHRRRLDAESIRDAVLLISGHLNTQMGGQSVRQFNESPSNHVTPNVDYLNFDVNAPANHRRSVYRFVFRTLPDPFMDALDCPDAAQLTPKRNTSLTALQALAMLNDKLIVRQSQWIAAREHMRPLEDQVKAIYLTIFGRPPAADETQVVCNYVAEFGLANACRMLLNTNEFLFID